MSEETCFGCEEAFRRLDDYLDRELTAEEMVAVRQHLEKCHDCAVEFQFEEQVLLRLKEKMRHIDLPPDLMSKLCSCLDEA